MAVAAAPNKHTPKRIQAFQKAVDAAAASVAAADTGNMIVAWEQREYAAGVLPQDGVHAAAKLSPNPSSLTRVDSQAVVPIVISITDKQYPACVVECSVLEQLPGFMEFFTTGDFADDEERAAYAAYDSFTITATITTHTVGRTTFVTSLQQG